MISAANFDPELTASQPHQDGPIRLEKKLPDGKTHTCLVDPKTTVSLGLDGVNGCEGTLWEYDAPPEIRGLARLIGKTKDAVGKLIGSNVGITIVEVENPDLESQLLQALGGYEYSRVGEKTLLIRATSKELQERIFQQRGSLASIRIQTIDPETVREKAARAFPVTKAVIVNDPGTFVKDENSDAAKFERGTLSESGKRLQEALEKLNVAEVVKNVCTLLGIPIPASLHFYLPPPGTSGAHVFQLGILHSKTLGNRAKITSIERLINRKLISLDLEGSIFTELESLCVHELTHYLLANAPDNETILEGTAEAVSWLYAEVFKKKNYWKCGGSPSQRIIEESGGTGRYLPDFSDVLQHNGLHNTQGSMGSSAILDCLGKTTSERLHTLRCLTKASIWDNSASKKGVGMNETRVLPSTEEYFDRLNNMQPGLGTALKEHPRMQAMKTGDYIEFHPANHVDPTSPWGTLTAFRFEENENFGLSRPHDDRYEKMQLLSDFDLNPGIITPFVINIKMELGDGRSYTFHTKDGKIEISPKLILFLLSENSSRTPQSFLSQDIKITATVKGIPHVLVEKARFTEEDLAVISVKANDASVSRQDMDTAKVSPNATAEANDLDDLFGKGFKMPSS